MADVQNRFLKTQDLIGKPVISLQGEEIGAVLRVIVNPGSSNVVGLTVSSKGLFKGEKGVEFRAIKSFGDFALMVETIKEILPIDSLPAIEKLGKEHNLFNMRIITPEGKLIGTIDDFYFHTGTGNIERYILSGGLIKNLFKGRASIPASSISTIGKDLLISIEGVEETIQKEEPGLQDSLGNIRGDLENWKDDLGQWKDDFEKTWDKTKTKTLEISKTVSANLKESALTGSGKGKEIISKTSEILNEKKEQLKSSYELWVERLQVLKSGHERPLPADDAKAIIGLKAGKTLTDDNGNVLIKENEKVTPEVIETSQKAGKIKELLISVATRDLEDKINSLESEQK